MNHLRELLDLSLKSLKIPNDVLQEPHAAEQLVAHHRLVQVSGEQSMCFFIGNEIELLELTHIEELCNLPFDNCWFEMEIEAFPQRKITRNCISVVKVNSELYLSCYVMLQHVWVMRWGCRMDSIISEFSDVCPDDNPSRNSANMAINAIRAFLTAMNCKNVKREQHLPSSKLQKARAKKGKKPLFSYWTLHLDGRKDQKESRGGTHSSPRLHLRRGHARQYAPEKYTWVQPCVVGNKSAGIVHKDYSAAPALYAA